ncbi:MAG: Dabb family protein [Lachnospiraceae bacterium]|nr:Dabb family protein [Lachnospiraceae bacterium]
MVRHIVMFELLEEAGGKGRKENLVLAKEKAEALREKIPSLKEYQVVVNAKKADQSNYDIALICDFEDMKGLEAYQNHPDHKAFGAFISGIRRNRACIDFEMEA